MRRAPPRPLHEVAAGQVVDHVCAGIAGGDQHGLDEVLGEVVDDEVGSEGGAQGSFSAPRYRNDPGSGGFAELNPSGAQSTGGGVDHQRFSRLEAPSFEQGQVGRLEGQKEGGCLSVVEVRWSIEDRDGVSDGVLGHTTEGVLGDGHDALAEP